MVETVKCPKCQGVGCDLCRGKGTLFKDEKGDYYVNGPESNSESSTKGLSNLLFKLLSKLFEEPHDFIWSIKKVKK